MVGAPHQGPRFDVPEAESERLSLQRREFIGRDIARYRQVIGGRPQVLAHSQDLDVVRPKILEDLDHFIQFLAKPDHDSGLAEHAGIDPLRALQ